MDVFISQPMKNRTEEEIRQERKQIIEYVKKLYPNETVNEVNSFFAADIQSKNVPLRLLGMSIELMAEADLVVLADHWGLSRGCLIEHACAQQYRIKIIDLEK